MSQSSRKPCPRKADRRERELTRLSVQFMNLSKALGLHRAGLGFYTLRHVFRTVADGARDPVAIDLIMGHSDPSVGGHYRERIEDGRLRAVAGHVHAWLLGDTPTPNPEPEQKPLPMSTRSGVPDRGAEGARPTLRLFGG